MKKAKNVQQIVTSGSEAQLFVLVGTYKKEPDQLKWIGKRHLYNYPLSAEEAQQTNEGWSKVKEAGKLRLEGKEYVVQDGDIMHFRFNV